MMTKKQLCEILAQQEEEAGITNVFQSSTYAVVKDFLGELSERDSEYAKRRGGVLFCGRDRAGNVVSLSIREILELLSNDTMSNQ